MATFKTGSDIILSITLKDGDGDAISLSSVQGYGINVIDPSGASIGLWGENLTGYTGSSKLKLVDANSLELNLSSEDYGAYKGVFKAEMLIKYTDTDFDDGFRHLHSERKDLFKIGDYATTESTDTTTDLTTSAQFTFEVSTSGSISQASGPYASISAALADDDLLEGSIFYLNLGVQGAVPYNLYIKITS